MIKLANLITNQKMFLRAFLFSGIMKTDAERTGRTQNKKKDKQMNNVTANEFDNIPADEMTEDVRRKAIIAELARLGFDDPEGFLDKSEDGFRLTEEEAQGLDDRVYDTLDNGWGDLCDSVDDEHITTGEDWIRDEEEWWASTGTIWDRYIQRRRGVSSNNEYEHLGEMYDWEPDMAYIRNIPIEFNWDSPFGESYDRVKEIFAKYARLFELGMAHEDYCLAWDAMIADCVHGKNDVLDEIAFCAVLIEPGMWDDDKFNEMWQGDAKWNYNCRKYGV